MSLVLVLPCPAVRSPGQSQVCDCKCYQFQGSWWARRTPEGTRPTEPGCPTSGRSDRCECVGCTWDAGTGAYWPEGVTPTAGTPAKSREQAAAPVRELPPTRSDRLCGRNRYSSLDAAFSALWAHAQARGYAATTMAVVAHDLCPDLFHIVPLGKASGFSEVHHVDA